MSSRYLYALHGRAQGICMPWSGSRYLYPLVELKVSIYLGRAKGIYMPWSGSGYLYFFVELKVKYVVIKSSRYTLVELKVSICLGRAQGIYIPWSIIRYICTLVRAQGFHIYIYIYTLANLKVSIYPGRS